VLTALSEVQNTNREELILMGYILGRFVAVAAELNLKRKRRVHYIVRAKSPRQEMQGLLSK
jgi:hypothetical protein